MNTELHSIPIMEPDLSGNEKAFLMDAIDSGWISSKGMYVEKFEHEIAAIHGCDNALVVSNGTVALHLGLVSLGIGPGDEVIVPNLTFASSVNAIIHAGATPVLVDVNIETYNIDCDKIEEYITPKTKAIMPVHLYGNPCDMDFVQSISKKHNLLVIEDNAEGLGSFWNGKITGSFGDVGTFSFFGNKTITTGEGGAILFKEEEIYQKAKVLRDHGMSPNKRYWHEMVGYNYRLTNIQAAIGCAQLERLDYFLNRKKDIVEKYTNELLSIDSITFQKTPSHSRNSFWLFTAIFNDTSRSELSKFMEDGGVETRPAFYPISDMPIYSNYKKGEYPVSSFISQNGLSLPTFPGLTDEQLDLIIARIKQYYD